MDELELTPQFRVEYFLDAIVNSTDCPYEARDRIEMFLERIAGADIVTPPPMYRIEFYLAKIAGDDVEIPEPQHRAEFYLAAICGEEVELPEPHDRIDYWLYQWAEGGSLPWATFTGNPLQFTAPKAHVLKSVKASFSPQQDLHGYANPWPAGGSDNLLPTFTQDASANGVTLHVNADGSVSFSGTATATTTFDAPNSTWTWDGSEACWLSGCPSGGNISSTYGLRIDTGDNTDWCNPDNGDGTALSGLSASSYGKALHFRIVIRSGVNTNGLVFKPMLNKGSSALPFKPYSNECPISGWTALNIYNEPDYDPTATPKLTVTWTSNGTVYGGYVVVYEDGSCDLYGTYEKHTLVGTETFFAYSNSNLDGFRMTASSLYKNSNTLMCNYMPPTNDSKVTGIRRVNGQLFMIGAVQLFNLADTTKETWKAKLAELNTNGTPFEVMEILAEPVLVAHLDPVTPPTAVAGINTIWSDANGDVTVEARGEAVNLSALQSLNMLLGGRYYNNGTADEPTDEEALDILLGRK